VAVRHGGGSSLRPEEVADAVGFPLVASISDDPTARSAYERGDAPSLRRRGPWAHACSAILDDAGVVDVSNAVA
jgi:hypothetical protein